MKIKLELAPKGVAVGMMEKGLKWSGQSKWGNTGGHINLIIAEYEANKLGFTMFEEKVGYDYET